MSTIKVKNVSTVYSLKDINLQVNDGEFLAVLGPSGAGKSTFLNVIAGLISYQGEVFMDGQKVDDLSPSSRGIGYVFQELLLFPHKTVSENIGFGLKMKGVKKEKIAERTAEMLNLLNISHLKDRYPETLSGGEKQRVALARTLAVRPKILLLDEPLSSLDYNIAKYLRLELKNLIHKLNLTTLYVTHNFNEAKEMADRIAVIIDGKLKQVGSVTQIFTEPAPELYQFIPAPNLFKVDDFNVMAPGLAQIHCKKLKLTIPWDHEKVNKIAILPQDVSLNTSPPMGNINNYQGTILDLEKAGPFIRCVVETGGNKVRVETPQEFLETDKLSVGEKIWIKFDMRKLHIIQ